MSAQHTAGPWFVGDEDEGCDGIGFIEVHAGEYGELTLRMVAHVQPEFGDDFRDIGDTDRANARLIAAAPDMLETLKLCIPAGVCLTNSNISDDLNVPIDVRMGDLRKIAAVIAKATGEAA